MTILTVGVRKGSMILQVWRNLLLVPPRWLVKRRWPEERN